MKLKSNIEDVQNVSYTDIYSKIAKQKEAISYFIEVEQVRLHIKEHLLPGRVCGQDHCKFNVSTSNYAADLIAICHIGKEFNKKKKKKKKKIFF